MFYAIIHKPYGVLSQFSSADGKPVLKDFFDVPTDVYPVGRLDADSEGLLVLTNDPSLNQALLHPARAHPREYWVQVDGAVTPEALSRLERGVQITVDGKPHHTQPCRTSLLREASTEEAMPTGVVARNPPVRFRKQIPTSWIKLELTEGKNRQVRKMTAAVGFPTLRLIRYRIEQCTLEGLAPGEMRMYSRQSIYRSLNIPLQQHAVSRKRRF